LERLRKRRTTAQSPKNVFKTYFLKILFFLTYYFIFDIIAVIWAAYATGGSSSPFLVIFFLIPLFGAAVHHVEHFGDGLDAADFGDVAAEERFDLVGKHLFDLRACQALLRLIPVDLLALEALQKTLCRDLNFYPARVAEQPRPL